MGGMSLLNRPDHGAIWPAKFISGAQFVGCVGLQEAEANDRLKKAFSRGRNRVRSFRIDGDKDDTCWFAGDGWWLSIAATDSHSKSRWLRRLRSSIRRAVHGAMASSVDSDLP